MAKIDPLERLADLVLLLLDTSTPLSLHQIANEIPGYPEAKDARRQAFERDKRLLREEGIEIEVVEIGGAAQQGYRIDPDRFFLPSLQLTTEEQVALAIAVAGTTGPGDGARGALAKLGVVGERPSTPLLELERPPAVAALFEAIRTEAIVHFSYLGEQRTVYPWLLRFITGHWYLEGYAVERAAERRYRVDRLEGPVTMGAPGSRPAPPEDLRRASGAVGVSLDEGQGLPGIVVEVDAVGLARLRAELGSVVTTPGSAAGLVRVALSASSAAMARSWVLRLGQHGIVVEPEHLRAELRQWLEAMLAPTSLPAEVTPPQVADHEPEPEVVLGRSKVRLRRLLSLVTWLAQVGEASITEIGERFAMTPEEVVAELELAACCGSPPYTPDALLDIMVDGDRVVATLPSQLAQPRRLGREEGFLLAAAGHAMLSIRGPGDEALASAVVKLNAALGAEDALEVTIDPTGRLEELVAAAATHRQLSLRYYSFHRDVVEDRVVTPLEVFTERGRGYLEAFCHQAGAIRSFRIDRIEEVADLGPVPSELEDVRAPSRRRGFFDGASEVLLVVDEHGAWVADSVPVLGVERRGTHTVISLAVSSERWMAELLVQLGAHGRVVAPSSMREVGATAARELLARYAANS